MNRTMFMVLALVGFSFSGCSSDLGRYQLIEGEYTLAYPSETFPVKTIFKIDTRTGHVWEWSHLYGMDGEHKSWNELVTADTPWRPIKLNRQPQGSFPKN